MHVRTQRRGAKHGMHHDAKPWLAVLTALLLTVNSLRSAEVPSTDVTNQPAETALPRVPNGFVIERVAPPQIRFPMFGSFDDQGRLYITESGGGDLYQELLDQKRTCRVSVLEDRDEDGRYERVQVFADQFVPSMGLVWRDGKLYVADPPDLVLLEDVDNDGKADRRTVILSGFGHTDNGSLHGLDFGPDGWLYMTMGWPDGYKLKRADGSWLSGKTGALFRCRGDGSEPQVLARGFDQLVELAFLPGGEIVGSQTWYQNPSGGLRDSLTHLVPEGQYPQHWQDEEPPVFATGDTLPAILILPAVAHSGLALYRGQQFPPEWRGELFAAEFNSRKVVRHPLQRDGATFRSESHDFVTSDDPDFRPADVLEDADGSLVILDTGSWYVQHCPTGRMRPTLAPGAIYRVRRLGADRIADPRGLRLPWNNASLETLVQRLSDARPAVRQRSVESLLRRGALAVPALAEFLEQSGADDEARASAVWTLTRIGGDDSLRALRRVLETEVSSMATPNTNAASLQPTCAAVLAAARALGLHADHHSAPLLEKLLRHPQAPLRMAAAEALAPCGRRESVSVIIDALASGADRMLEHALICALRRHATAAEMRANLEHSYPGVQKAALLVLDQTPHHLATPMDVLPRLSSTNEPLRRAAEFCLRRHPEWAGNAVDFLRQELRMAPVPPARETALFELLHAFQQEPALDGVIAQALVEPDQNVSVARKARLLAFIAADPRPQWPGSWVEALTQAFRHPSDEIRAEAARAATAARINLWDTSLWQIAHDPKESAGLRVEALASLARRQPSLDSGSFTLLLTELRRTDASLVRLRAAEVFASTEPPPAAFADFLDIATTEAFVSPTLVIAAARRTSLSPETTARLLDYLAMSVDRGWPVSEAQLDWTLKAVPEAARPQAAKLSKALRDQTEKQQALLRDYEPLLLGGDATRGRSLFFEKAQCFTCHTVGNQGRNVGPDLTKVGTIRSGRDILESVLLPSATFAQGYDSYVAETGDDESITGLLERETPEFVVMRGGSGAELRLRRNEVKSLTKSRLSLMPEGILQQLTREEVSDLFAFLQDLK